MIKVNNFILPNAYFYSQLNNCLVQSFKINTKLFKDKINFIGENANLPFSIWNGGTLINDKFLNKNEIEKLYELETLPLIIDCSNIFISASDIFNLKENIFLNKYHTGLNYIIISDPNFLILLKNKYPYYSFILSPYFPQENITNELIDKCTFIMNYYNNINSNIPKNKLLIILPINEICYMCKKFLYCSKEEQENIYNFKTISQFRGCIENQPYTLQILNYNIFNEKGYTNFIFDERAFPLRDQILMAHFYADFFGIQGHNQEVFSLLTEAIQL